MRSCFSFDHRLSAASPHAGDRVRNCAGRFRGNAGMHLPWSLVLACGGHGGTAGPKREQPPRRNVKTSCVVRERIELSTFRFSEGLSPTAEHPLHAPESPIDLHTGLLRGCGSSLAGVPTCAAECRFVRVMGVLDPSRTRGCVPVVLAGAALVNRSRLHPDPSAPARGPKPGRRRPSTWSATHLAIPPPVGQAANDAP